ncbi:hypothetical protein SANTM175S_02717 [Streptomyces antimycoticus]
MSQVERGIQPVQRVDLLQQLADELGVSMQQLRPGTPGDVGGKSSAPAPLSLSNDLDETRRLISGHPALRTLLASPVVTAEGKALEALRSDVDDLWELTHAGQLAQVSALTVELLPELERAVRTAVEEQRSELYLLLSRAYQALSAAFVRQDEADAAWVTADRAVFAAERSGHPLHVSASVFRMVQAFVRLRSLGQAEHAARTAPRRLAGTGQRLTAGHVRPRLPASRTRTRSAHAPALGSRPRKRSPGLAISPLGWARTGTTSTWSSARSTSRSRR